MYFNNPPYKIFITLFCLLLVSTSTTFSDTITVTSDIVAPLYTRPSGSSESFQLVAKETPFHISVDKNERYDLLVSTHELFFVKLSARRDNASGGMSISLKLERSLDWLRVLGVLALAGALGGYLFSRRFKKLDNQLHTVTQQAQWLSDQATKAIPTRIGPYQVEKLLGRGGMGSVYLANEPNRKGNYVLKVPFEIDERFAVECATLVRCQHPNIVRIFDYTINDPKDGTYLVMEHIEGDTLDKVFRTHKILPLQEVVSLGVQLYSALGYIHEKKIIHRDLKPANIFWLERRELKLLDFGIAKQGNSALTQSWELLGTPLYASPEQANSKYVDASSDIYSAGVILLQALLGQLPWQQKDPLALLVAKQKPIHPRHLEKMITLPSEFAELILSTLHPNPLQRPQNAHEIAQKLHAHL